MISCKSYCGALLFAGCIGGRGPGGQCTLDSVPECGAGERLVRLT